MSPKQRKAALVYTGAGYGGALPGIPARDLTAEEVKEHGGRSELLETGLYEEPKAQKKEGD